MKGDFWLTEYAQIHLSVKRQGRSIPGRFQKLCSLLVRGAWDAERIDAFVCAVARAAGDEEWERRGKGQHTLAHLAAGAKATGGPTLEDLLGGGHRAMGQAIVARVREWLGLPGHDDLAGGKGASPGAHPGAHPDAHPTPDTTMSTWEIGEGRGGGKPVGQLLSDVVEEEVTPLFGSRLYAGMLALLTAEQLMSAGGSAPGAVLDRAEALVMEWLADGPLPQRAIQERAAAQRPPVSWASIRRAQAKLGIHPKQREFGGPWIWKLPTEPPGGDSVPPG